MELIFKQENQQDDILDVLLDTIEKGDIKVVKEIVGSQIDLEEDIGESATILMHACGVGSIKTVKFLVELGAGFADQLVRVYQKGGSSIILLIHLEDK